MPSKDKPLSQQYYEEVEALKAEGVSNAEAIRQVAATHGKKENAVRGGINQYKRIHLGASGSSPRSRRKAKTIDDHVASAKESLEAAMELIDDEVSQAKAQLETAQARYDEIVASVQDRKEDIEKKLAALA
jgi:uncharacterized protein YoaH (UPF0181 family)